MKVLVTGATGYLGAVAAAALAAREHEVVGLARSQRSANTLPGSGIQPVTGDFGDPVGLAGAVHENRPDVVVSTASGDNAAFARDCDAVHALAVTAVGAPDLMERISDNVLGALNDLPAHDRDVLLDTVEA